MSDDGDPLALSVSVNPPQEGEDSFGWVVGVIIRQPDGTQRNALQGHWPDAPPGLLVQSLLACARAATAHQDPIMGTMLDDAVSVGSVRGTGLTVAVLDQMADAYQAQYGSRPQSVGLPGMTEPVDYEVARSVLVAAGCWR